MTELSPQVLRLNVGEKTLLVVVERHRDDGVSPHG